MKHRWGWCAAVALLAVLAMQAQAKEKKSAEVTSASILKRMDRDGDGKVGQEEFRNAMMRRFSAADADNNGVLSGDEIPTHSIVVSKSEGASNEVKLEDFSAAIQPVFEGFDADRDGHLAGAEVEALAQARRHAKEAKP